jgi:hypothetical protein
MTDPITTALGALPQPTSKKKDHSAVAAYVEEDLRLRLAELDPDEMDPDEDFGVAFARVTGEPPPVGGGTRPTVTSGIAGGTGAPGTAPPTVPPAPQPPLIDDLKARFDKVRSKKPGVIPRRKDVDEDLTPDERVAKGLTPTPEETARRATAPGTDPESVAPRPTLQRETSPFRTTQPAQIAQEQSAQQQTAQQGQHLAQQRAVDLQKFSDLVRRQRQREQERAHHQQLTYTP